MAGLTQKQERFVEEYLIDLNATQAAIRAGYSAKRADAIGFENLRKPEIAKVIARRRAELSGALEITQERVLRERARLAFFDPRKLFSADGTPKAITELDDDTVAAVAGLDVVNIGNPDHGVGQVLKYKIADKSASLTALEKHLGLYEADNKQTGKREVILKHPVDLSRLTDEELAVLEKISTDTDQD
jgi:phage terminase small subunit